MLEVSCEAEASQLHSVQAVEREMAMTVVMVQHIIFEAIKEGQYV